MSGRYLFGPVTRAYAEQNLAGPRQQGDCLAFGVHEPIDLCVQPSDTWETIASRLPSGWRPDFVVLYLPYATIPRGLWSAPVPLIGLAADWNLQWHAYQCLSACELVFTDTVGVETLSCAGIGHAHVANLFGCQPFFLEAPPTEATRDIDILFVGSLHRSVQRQRLGWLGRIARMAERWRVVIQTEVFGDDYRSLLRRARIVFNHSIRGECNRRVFEAAAAGARAL